MSAGPTMAEVAAMLHEIRELVEGDEPVGSPRWRDVLARKRDLIDRMEAAR